MARNCLVINLDRCIGCYACEVACKMENDIALGERWNKVVQVEPFGEFPHVSTYWLPVMCQQCEESPCTHVCPTGASYRDEATGMVLVGQGEVHRLQVLHDGLPLRRAQLEQSAARR